MAKRPAIAIDSPEGWRKPVELDVTAFLRPGPNQLAIAAINAADQPNPAGLIGRLRVELASGGALTESVSKAWTASNQKVDHWTEAGFDDSAWPSAREVVPFGAGPWGMLGGHFTLSPVKADPYFGHCDLASADLKGSRVYLELGALAPELAARVTRQRQKCGRLHRQARPPRNRQALERRPQHIPHRALCAGIHPAGDVPGGWAGAHPLKESDLIFISGPGMLRA